MWAACLLRAHTRSPRTSAMQALAPAGEQGRQGGMAHRGSAIIEGFWRAPRLHQVKFVDLAIAMERGVCGLSRPRHAAAQGGAHQCSCASRAWPSRAGRLLTFQGSVLETSKVVGCSIWGWAVGVDRRRRAVAAAHSSAAGTEPQAAAPRRSAAAALHLGRGSTCDTQSFH